MGLEEGIVGVSALINSMPTFDRETLLLRQGYSRIVGVDEAGRGAWAGPLYAGAVILSDESAGILQDVVRDSKMMSVRQRENAYDVIIAHAVAWGVGFSSHTEIDTLGLTRANQLAAERALEQLTQPYDYVILDGRLNVSFNIPQHSIIDGDAQCLSIAAASILAKVSRDRVMLMYHNEYPHYGFDKHLGYGTRNHQQALKIYGVCPLHRTSYAPIRALLDFKKK